MKKLYSFCFVFLILIGINMNVTLAQETETITDTWEILGIYKSNNGDAVTYVYKFEGRLILRMLSWDDPNKVGITPPAYDEKMTIVGMTDDGIFYTEIEGCVGHGLWGDVFPEERYCFSRENGTIRLQQPLPVAPPYYKIADFYTKAGIEGPLPGIFCGDAMSDDYAYICIKAAPTNEEVWKLDSVQSDNYPEIGTPVEYSVQKYNVFDPETLTSHSEDAVISIQPKQ